MTAWALDTLVAFSLLLLLVLVVRQPVARLFGAPWAYALWLIPAARLVLPPLPFLEDVAPLLAPASALVPLELTETVPPTGAAVGWPWAMLALALWALGAALFCLWQWLGYRAFLRGLSAGLRRAAPASFGGIPVVESEAADGPLAIGILDPRIVVPPLFEHRYSPAEQRLALEHELIHHRRGDLWWNAAALGVLALNWFNPIAHFAFRAFRIDQELACDALVARRSPAERHDYARALVKSAARPGLVAACPLNRADQLKRRLKMMKQHRASAIRTWGGAAAVALLAVGGLGLSAPGFAEEKKIVREMVIKKMGKDGKTVVIDGQELSELKAKCIGPQAESDVTSGDETNKHRTRIIICGDGKANSAEMNAQLVTSLEQARARLAEQDDIGADRRTEALAALDREIARLRAGR